MSEEAAKKEPRIIKTTIVLRVDAWYRKGETRISDIRKAMESAVIARPLSAGVTGIALKGSYTSQPTDGR